jgi:7-cyano-7-deazaguanine synthase
LEIGVMPTGDTSILERAALVLFSGGQDSSTVLAWAIQRYQRVETVGFRYGQRHLIEMDIRQRFRDKLRSVSSLFGRRLGADHEVDLDLIGQLGAKKIPSPTDHSIMQKGHFTSGNRYLPGRNLVMLSIAAVVGFRRDIYTLVCGASETEYSGYPDCRSESIQAINAAINLSSDLSFDVQTPLMQLDKAGVWRLAYEIGGKELVDTIIEDTHTCYQGDRVNRYDWGYGCAECPACRLRAKGWREFSSGS